MKKLFTIIIGLVMVGFTQAQTKVGSVTLPNVENFGDYELVLNGAGVREKIWIDLYAAGLYLQEKSSNANAIIKADKPMSVKLHIVSSLINSKKMISAIEEGFENSTNGNAEPYRAKIDQFIAFFKEEIKKGDIYDITYQPGKGVVSYKNGEEKGTVKGKDFKEALFGIWLSNRPADDDLKEGMLGE